MQSHNVSRAANSVFSDNNSGSAHFRHDNGLFYRTFLALLRAQEGEADLTALARQAVDKTNFETRILHAAQAGEARAGGKKLVPDRRDGGLGAGPNAGEIAAFIAQVWSLDMPGSEPLVFQVAPALAASPEPAESMPAEAATAPDGQAMPCGEGSGPDNAILSASSSAGQDEFEPVTVQEEASFEPTSMDVLMMMFGDMQRQTGTYADNAFGGGVDEGAMLDIRQSA